MKTINKIMETVGRVLIVIFLLAVVGNTLNIEKSIGTTIMGIIIIYWGYIPAINSLIELLKEEETEGGEENEKQKRTKNTNKKTRNTTKKRTTNKTSKRNDKKLQRTSKL